MIMKRLSFLLFCFVVLGTFSVKAALEENVAGTVKHVTGSALAVQNAEIRQLKVGDPVMIGDILSTGTDSRLEIAMVDDGKFKLGAKTSFVVVDYTFGTKNDNVVMELLNGAMDGVSGQIAKANPDGMKVVTRSATIGIRGTKFFVGEMNGDNDIHVAHWSGGGVHVKNYAGEVFLKDEGVGTIIEHHNKKPAAPESWAGEKQERAKSMTNHS
jgi:FecR-like protein